MGKYLCPEAESISESLGDSVKWEEPGGAAQRKGQTCWWKWDTSLCQHGALGGRVWATPVPRASFTT